VGDGHWSGSGMHGRGIRYMMCGGYRRLEHYAAAWSQAGPHHTTCFCQVSDALQTINSARKSLTFVNVGPLITKSPSGLKKW
jgi:hypothetical protein